MELTPGQRYIIARSQEVADDPDSVIPDDYPADDYNGRNAFLVGYLAAQLKALADVAGDIAGPDEQVTP